MKRRDFLNLSVVTAATVALAGCGHPAEPVLISQAHMPEFYLPGIAQWFATTCSECSAGCGIGVRVIGGRAKKIEGIESHPLSRGGHCLRAETSLQSLYNPDRLNAPVKGSAPVGSWDEPLAALSASFDQPAGLWITGPLSGTVGGMVVAAARASGAKIWVIDFSGGATERAAMRTAGQGARLPYYNIADADYVVNFGGDFLSSAFPNNVEYNWQYGQFRNGIGRRSRGILVSFASRMNLTVSCSDRWVPVKPGTEGIVASAVAKLLGSAKGLAHASGEGKAKKKSDPVAAAAAQAAGIDEDLIHRLVERLAGAKKAVAIGGFDNTIYSNGLSTMAAIMSLNNQLPGNKMATFEPDMLMAPKGSTVTPPGDLLVTAKQALDGLKAGTFTTIWVNDVNPAYLFPQKGLGVSDALAKANTFVFSPYTTETSVLAKWTLPITSMLEQWADVRIDGPNPVYGIQQPVVMPVPGTRPLGDLLVAAFSANAKLKATVPVDPVKKEAVTTMRDVLISGMSKADWVRALERGGIYKDAPIDWSPYPAQPMFPPPLEPATSATMPAAVGMWDNMNSGGAALPGPATFSGKGKFVLIPYLSPTLGDGSITNRPWAPELPDPMMQVVWSTWVEINPEVCKKLGIERYANGDLDLVKITADNGESVTLPAIPSPTVHEEAIAIPMGMGHTSFGRYAYNKGYNPLRLLTPAFQDGTDEFVLAGTTVSIAKTGEKGFLTTYDHRAYGTRSLYED